MWHWAAFLLYVPELSQWTLCSGLRWRYKTHIIKPFNLSSPNGKASVADAIVAAWVLSGILSSGWAKRQTAWVTTCNLLIAAPISSFTPIPEMMYCWMRDFCWVICFETREWLLCKHNLLNLHDKTLVYIYIYICIWVSFSVKVKTKFHKINLCLTAGKHCTVRTLLWAMQIETN